MRENTVPAEKRSRTSRIWGKPNRANAIKSYTNPFIVIQIYKFPSLPLIYNFCSLVCHCRYFFVDPSCTPLKLCHGGVQVVSSSNQRSASASDGETCQRWRDVPAHLDKGLRRRIRQVGVGHRRRLSGADELAVPSPAKRCALKLNSSAMNPESVEDSDVWPLALGSCRCRSP